MKQYLNSLIRKHRNLDEQIAQLGQTGNPKFGTTQIRELKKLRLMMKDRITQIRRQMQGQTQGQMQ